MITDLTSDLFGVLLEILWWYRIIVILAVIWFFLAQYDVLDRRNRAVWTIGNVLERLTEPLLRPIRRRVPPFGGFDWSPFILLLLILVLRQLLVRLEIAVLTGDARTLVL